MLCTYCVGIRLTDLVSFETECDGEVATCLLLNTHKAYHHQTNFEALLRSGEDGCPLCLLMSQILEEDQNWNADDRLYGSIQGEAEHDLVLKLRSEFTDQIYVYRVDGTERQEDAGIFEIAVVSTFSYDQANASKPRASPDAFFWRALEVWPETGKRCLS